MLPYRSPAPETPCPPRRSAPVDLAVGALAALQLAAALVGLAWLAGARPGLSVGPAALVVLVLTARSAR